MIKATVLYGHLVNADAFGKYYTESHIQLVAKASGGVTIIFGQVEN